MQLVAPILNTVTECIAYIGLYFCKGKILIGTPSSDMYGPGEPNLVRFLKLSMKIGLSGYQPW